MKLFGRKKEENDEEAGSKDSDSSAIKRRRKKKEPEKPWGKKERILILILIIITVGASVYFSLRANGWRLPKLRGINVSSISIPFVTEETVTIEADK